MRSLIARLSLAGLVGIAFSGCGSNGTAYPSGGLSNNGGGSVPGTGGVGALPSCSLGTNSVYMIDTGNAVNNADTGPTWTPFNNGLADVQGVGDPTGNDPIQYGNLGNSWTTYPSCVPPEPNVPTFSPPAPGFQDFLMAGSASTQVIIKDTNTIPNLTYQYHGYFFNYTAIVFHMSWPQIASLTQPSTVAIELVGNGSTNATNGALATSYDVRNPCTIYPTAVILPTPEWSTLVCPLNGGATGYGTVKNTQGPNAVLPGAAGTFTPIDPTLFVVFNYGKSTNPSQDAEPYLTYMYAYQ